MRRGGPFVVSLRFNPLESISQQKFDGGLVSAFEAVVRTESFRTRVRAMLAGEDVEICREGHFRGGGCGLAGRAGRQGERVL